VESGLNGTVKSEARAVGFCQWLDGNWRRLNRLSSHVIEAGNQTTQAPYCAAYLTVLATKYGSFVPALSEHHAGGTNVGRVIIKGERMGGVDIRSQYLLGSAFAPRKCVATTPRWCDACRPTPTCTCPSPRRAWVATSLSGTARRTPPSPRHWPTSSHWRRVPSTGMDRASSGSARALPICRNRVCAPRGRWTCQQAVEPPDGTLAAPSLRRCTATSSTAAESTNTYAERTSGAGEAHQQLFKARVAAQRIEHGVHAQQRH
jgi:hypothetical protein